MSMINSAASSKLHSGLTAPTLFADKLKPSVQTSTASNAAARAKETAVDGPEVVTAFKDVSSNLRIQSRSDFKTSDIYLSNFHDNKNPNDQDLASLYSQVAIIRRDMADGIDSALSETDVNGNPDTASARIVWTLGNEKLGDPMNQILRLTGSDEPRWSPSQSEAAPAW